MAAIKGIEGMTGAQLQAELQKGGKFVVYQYCISILVMTFKRGSAIHFVRADESAAGKGMLYTALSLLFGWCGIPWGPIYTIEALVINLKGGRDVTAQVLEAMQRPAPAPAAPLANIEPT